MAIDASEVVVGGDGRVYVAPAGTAVPTSATASLPATWVDVGYISEDGVTFLGGSEQEDINAWQSYFPIRKLITARSAAVEFILRQWNGDTLKLAFGGGSVVTDAGTTYYAAPAPGTVDPRAMIIEWEDGSETYRLVIPRGQVTGDVETQLVRTAAADLPVSFAATPDQAPSALSATPTAGELITQAWYLVTDTTSFTT